MSSRCSRRLGTCSVDRRERAVEPRIERALRDELRQRPRRGANQARVVLVELAGSSSRPFCSMRLRSPTSCRNSVPSRACSSRSSGASASTDRCLRRHPRRGRRVHEARAQFDAAAGFAGQQQRRLQVGDALQALLQFGDDRRARPASRASASAWPAARRCAAPGRRWRAAFAARSAFRENRRRRCASLRPRYRWCRGRTSSPPAWSAGPRWPIP